MHQRLWSQISEGQIQHDDKIYSPSISYIGSLDKSSL